MDPHGAPRGLFPRGCPCFNGPVPPSLRILVAALSCTLACLAPSTAGAVSVRIIVGTDAGIQTRAVPVGAVAATIDRLEADPDVLWAEVDRQRSVIAADPAAGEVAAPDPAQSLSWGLESLRWSAVAAEASASTARPIAVLDTGFDLAHPAFAAADGTTRFTKVWNATTTTMSVPDDAGHGTAVASMAGGTHVAGSAAVGVAPTAPLIGVRIADENGRIYVSAEVRAIRWAVANGAGVINLSVGSQSPSTAEHAAIADALRAGVVVVAAAGNDGDQGVGAIDYPAAYPEVIAVGAIDRDDDVPGFSSHGATLALAAPGVDVDVARSGGAWRTWSGTSFAAPAVAGAASILGGMRPDWTPAQVRAALVETARDIDVDGWDERSGSGALDLAAAVEWTLAAPPAADDPVHAAAAPAAATPGPAAATVEPAPVPPPSAAPTGNLVAPAPTPTAARPLDRFEPNALSDALIARVAVSLLHRGSATLASAVGGAGDHEDVYVVGLPHAAGTTLRLQVLGGAAATRPQVDVLRVVRGRARSVRCVVDGRHPAQLVCAASGAPRLLVRVTARSASRTAYRLSLRR
ncbi:MAG: putative in [Thermoleophilia bacterium]|nr:putative in [Thermoleophilia bacterium]